MPCRFDFDRSVREFHTLSPAQQNLVVQRAVEVAKEARVQAMKHSLRRLGRRSQNAIAWVYRMLRMGWLAAQDAAVRAGARYQHRRRRQLAAARLHTMDDRMLKDIGLNRGDIDFVLSGKADPTRTPRGSGRVRDPLQSLRPGAEKSSAQRAGLPLVLRNSCAG